jgi:hypothetical protein
MAFLSPRKTKELIKGQLILPSVIVWEDSDSLKTVSPSNPLPVKIITGGVEYGFSFIGSGKKIISTAGTRETLVNTSTPCKEVLIMALPTNTGEIWVGDSNVSASDNIGVVLYSKDAVLIEIDNLQKVYLDATIDGEGVSYIYIN